MVAARHAEVLEEVASEVRARGRRALAVPTDVTVSALLDRTLETFGRLDVLVNNAGDRPPMIALAVSDDKLEAAYRFNVTAAVRWLIAT